MTTKKSEVEVVADEAEDVREVSEDDKKDLARRRGVVVLEVLAGLLGASEAADKLGMALQGYYHLEERAVKGLVAACEPQPRGPRRDYSREVEDLQEDKARLEAEITRYQALVRTAQLSVGVVEEEAPKTKGKKKRNRRPSVRALRAIDQLESKAKAR